MTRPLVSLILVLSCAVSASALMERPVSPLTLTAVAPNGPALVSDGQNFVAAWTDDRDPLRPAVYGARITPDRKVLDPVGVRLLEGHDVVAVASGLGHTFILGQSLRFVIVDRAMSIVARGVVAGESADRVQVVFNGSDFVAFWSKDALRTATLDPFGNMVWWPDNVIADRPVLLQSAATDGSRMLVAYSDRSTLFVAGTSTVGAVLWKDKVVARNHGWWTPASIAADDGVFGMAWLSRDVQDQPWEDRIRTVMLDGEGNATAPSRVAIPWPATAQIVATVEGFRLFESQELRVMSYRLTDELTPATADPVVDVARPRTVTSFATASGPGGAMVVAGVGAGYEAEVERGLYAADGDVVAPPVLVSRAGTTQTRPDVAVGDDGMLVAWEERTSVEATLLARDGSARTLTVATRANAPAVAANGDVYLVAWSTVGGARTRVLRDGGSLLSVEIALSEIGSSIVAASTNGRDFVVATATSQRVTPLEVYRIDVEGRVVGRTSVPTTSQSTVPRVKIACDDAGCLLTWVEQKPLGTNCFNIRCTLVDQVLAVELDPTLTPVSAPFALTEPLSLRIASLDAAARNGTYAVAWDNFNGSVSARTIERNQQLGAAVTVPGSRPAIEPAGEAWLLVRGIGTELIAAHLRATELHGATKLARDDQRRGAPALARRGGETVIAYERSTLGEPAGGVVRVYVSSVASIVPKRRSARN